MLRVSDFLPVVCKIWSSLIQNPGFISTHLSLSSSSSKSQQPSIFIRHYGQRRRVFSCHFNPESFYDCHTIPFPLPLPDSFIMIGHIHGLFCFSNYPAVGPRSYGLVGSGTLLLDESLRMWKHDSPHTSNCKIFSVKKGSWRTIGGVPQEAEYCSTLLCGLFINGALHWVAEKNSFVFVFDIAHETSKKMELPQKERHDGSYRHTILEINGSLTCVDYDLDDYLIWEPQQIRCYNIWVMKEYGVANSWVKMLTIELTGKLS